MNILETKIELSVAEEEHELPDNRTWLLAKQKVVCPNFPSLNVGEFIYPLKGNVALVGSFETAATDMEPSFELLNEKAPRAFDVNEEASKPLVYVEFNGYTPVDNANKLMPVQIERYKSMSRSGATYYRIEFNIEGLRRMA